MLLNVFQTGFLFFVIVFSGSTTAQPAAEEGGFFPGLLNLSSHAEHSGQAVSVDACKILELRSHAESSSDEVLSVLSRAVAPPEAGREGLDATNGGNVSVKFDLSRVINALSSNVSFAVKFYVNFGRDPRESTSVEFFKMVDMIELDLSEDNEIVLYYNVDGGKHKYWKKITISAAHKNIPEFVELISMKLQLSQERQKRNQPVELNQWVMIGIEYSYNQDNARSDVNAYINGKRAGKVVMKGQERLHIPKYKPGMLQLQDAMFSCIEFQPKGMGEEYLQDANLKECKAKYKGEPEEKYLECEKTETTGN